MNRKDLVLCLVGFPGVGKLTIARVLSARINALVVDNHWISDPILRLVAGNGSAPVTPAVWPQVAKVRAAVLETIAALSPPGISFIFTHAGSNEDPADRAAFDEYRDVASRRGAHFIPVRLLCAEAELVRRVASPDRQGRKLTDVTDARNNVRHFTPLDPGSQDSLTLNVTDLTSEAAATAILAHVEAVRG